MKRNLVILFVFSVVVFQWSPLHSQTTNTSIENKGIVTVKGLVTDEDSQTGVPGVTVMLKGTNTGTVTDRDGKYVINASESGGVLIFSFVGYATQEIELGNRSVIDVVLKPDTYLLEEFVIVGYGEQRKSDITGSISSIEVENLDRLPVASIDDAMIGKAAGVQISKQSGTPGTGVRVRIRGTNSISASNDPLYVVDGIPMIPESNSKVNASEDFPDYLNTKSNSITDINPADIASIEILKDASATAIYGSRGANGVVL
ncbi:MAG TPA: TonB-dependent receptor plug domain-containing protein, partial [Cyclobacteriaceae bacterium]